MYIIITILALLFAVKKKIISVKAAWILVIAVVLIPIAAIALFAYKDQTDAGTYGS